MSRRRLMGAIALLAVPALLIVAVTAVADKFPGALLPIACVVLAGPAGWYGLLHHGAARSAGAAAAVLALALAVVLLVMDGLALEAVLIVAGLVLLVGCSRAALRVHVSLPRAPRPRTPVLFFNPKSGGGKATRLSLAREARDRGIEPIELTPGSDLEQLVRGAVAGGADALAMAGGDGSQAIVAAIASELDLPYACVPAGTRNHFALDLGVDRDDVVGALDAFVDGGERRVDLARVNGRVFVNNVSLGLYAEAVQRPGYREAKIRTLLDLVPDVMGPDGQPPNLRWSSPSGREHRSSAAILVSNNQYRLGHAVGSGTRPRIDDGLLGITVVSSSGEREEPARVLKRPWREWSAPAFEVGSSSDVAAGIDGEAAVLTPPLRFEIMPRALRVRIARAHPGASPSAGIPDSAWDTARALMRIAGGRDPSPPAHNQAPTNDAHHHNSGSNDGHL
jgi:diacylglycerol kinase family enzyme